MNKFFAVAVLMFGVCAVSCSDDDNEISYSEKAMENSELKTILMQKGYQFSEDGKLLLDDLANNTTTLDLSGTKLTDFSELDILPNLTDVDLSDNGYGPTFDFSKLPEQITGIDLTGNEIYDYNNLAELDEKENVNVLRSGLTKLYLPAEAKDNCTAIMLFYFQNKDAVTGGSIDMKIENEDGNLQTYTSMRDVPDAVLREYLQSQFSNMFEGEQIDITNSFGLDEQTNSILIEESVIENIDAITSLEGLQYIVMHPLWKGTTLSVILNSERKHGSEDFSQNVALPRLKIGANMSKLMLENVNIEKGLDLSEAINVFKYQFEGIALETLDLSKSSIWGQRGESVEYSDLDGSSVRLHDLPLLKKLLLPENIYINKIDIECLPALATADLSSIQKASSITIGDLGGSTALTYPTLAGHYTAKSVNTIFACSENTWERPETQAFVKTYYTDKDTADKLAKASSLTCGETIGCRWWRK